MCRKVFEFLNLIGILNITVECVFAARNIIVGDEYASIGACWPEKFIVVSDVFMFT